MKLFPFQEAFKSGSSVCPHRKFLCFNFPKKEISLRSEPSICLWAELFQETLAAESWKHPWFSAAAGMSEQKVGFSPQGGTHWPWPTHSPVPSPHLTSSVTPRTWTLWEGISTCNFNQTISLSVDLGASHTNTHTHKQAPHSHHKALQHKARIPVPPQPPSTQLRLLVERLKYFKWRRCTKIKSPIIAPKACALSNYLLSRMVDFFLNKLPQWGF